MQPLLRSAPATLPLLASVVFAASPAPKQKAGNPTPELPPASATAVWEPIPVVLSAPAKVRELSLPAAN